MSDSDTSLSAAIEPGGGIHVFRVRHEYADRCREEVESQTEPVVAVVARSDASEWENIVNYDRETGTAGTRVRRA